MHPALASCRLFLDVLRGLIDGVRAWDAIGGGMADRRPVSAPKSVAARLAAGLRMIEAYLRRVLIVLALELEPTLVDAAKPMRRPHGRKVFGRPPRFSVLNEGASASWDARDDLAAARWLRRRLPQPAPGPVALGRLYRRLDQLACIAADPLSPARRLAFHLARSRNGVLRAPDLDLPAPRTWRRMWDGEASMTFSALAHEILNRSHFRPPPLPPPRRCWPTVMVLAW